MATKILEVNLANGPQGFDGLSPYNKACVFVRWNSSPLGMLWLSIPQNGNLSSCQIWLRVKEEFSYALNQAILTASVQDSKNLPTATVVICTRNRPDDLRLCLHALVPQITADDVEILIIDNAPTDDRTRKVVQDFPVRYVIESRQGLNWARHRGAMESDRELILYMDDDAVANANWVKCMRQGFSDAQTAAVTGLILPYELETEAQEKFEKYIGFCRGFTVREFTARIINPLAAANVGAGACMGIRRELILKYNLFHLELDCGTPSQSGGDTYASYRLLSEGFRLVYNPQAWAKHRHRRSMKELHRTLYGYAVGTFVFFLLCFLRHGDVQALYAGAQWFYKHILGDIWRSLRNKPGAPPLRFSLEELRGSLVAPWAYAACRLREWRSHEKRIAT